MEVRAKEYAPPACGRAGDISAIEKHSPMYISGHDREGQQHAAEPAGGEPEIPAEEIARDDRAHAHGPQVQHAGVAAQAPLGKVLGSGSSVSGLH